MSLSVKSIRKKFKENGVFYTPPELAFYLKSFVNFEPRDVYDPTCGDGSLLAIFGDGVPKYGQELDADQLYVAKNRLINFTGVAGDTLERPAFYGKKFHCIIANPPFSISWNPPEFSLFEQESIFFAAGALPPKSKADYAFILHILSCLADDGLAVVLCFPGILYRQNAELKIRKWLIEQNFIDKIIRVEGGKFEDTAVETAILVLRKSKTTTNILFSDPIERLDRSVSIEEVSKNNFSLSINSYLEKQSHREPFDAVNIQFKARQRTLQYIQSDIAADRMVCEFEGWDHSSFIKQIKDLPELKGTTP